MPAKFQAALVGVLALLLTMSSSAIAKDFKAVDYWDFADQEAKAVAPFWDGHDQLYETKQDGMDTKFNAAMLLLHASAAVADQTGPSRADARVIAIADRLTKYPAYLSAKAVPPKGDPQAHVPGWHNTMSDDALKNQHIAIDAQVARALDVAWLVADKIGMPPEIKKRIQRCIVDVAAGPFYKTRRLNQINWPSDLYASAVATGAPVDFLRRGLRRQLIWLAHNAKPSDGKRHAGNFSEGYGLLYEPLLSPKHPLNVVTTTEYGNIVASALTHLPQALLVGMKPLPKDVAFTLAQFQLRELIGEWTVSGYPNWDSGFGLSRIHLVRYWAHAQGTLIAFAKGTGLELYPGQAAWAKSVLDHGFETYTRWSKGTGLLPVRPLGLAGQETRDEADPPLDAARMGANAALAVLEGLPRRTAVEMPPVYAIDHDIGRLAISTPSYSAAIVRRSNAGYGGIELARLMGPQSQILGTLGGHGADSFGMRILGGGRTLLDTQPGTRLGVHPLSYLRGAPRGRGTFHNLTVSATGDAFGLHVRVANAFTAGSVTTTRAITGGTGGRTGELRFPSPQGATWTSISGHARPPLAASGSFSGTRTFAVRNDEGGYDLRLLRLPAGTRWRIAHPAAQPTAPHPGPTLLVTFPLRAGSTSVVSKVVPSSKTPASARR